MTDPGDLLPQRLRLIQIIAAAMLSGVATLLAIALYLVWAQNQGRGMAPPQGSPMVSYIAVAVLITNAPLAVVLPGMQTRNSLRRIASGTWQVPPGGDPTGFTTDTAKLLVVRQTTLIIALALLEGAAFLGGIAYLLEAQPLALVVVAVATALMLAQFPTESRVRAWLEQQADALAAVRQHGGLG
jgi:hypothetical protein